MNLLRNISFWLPVLLSIIVALVFSLFLHYVGLSWYLAANDGVTSSILLMVASFTGIRTVNSYPTKLGLFFYALVIGLLCAYATWFVNETVLKWWLWYDKDYVAWFHQTKYVRLFIFLLTSGWMLTHAALKRKTEVLESQFRDIRDAATLHREAELFKLRQQLQPHFLYNSLNSISALIMIFPDKAQEMIGKLSDFLRNSVKREGREQIPIREELEYIEAYLSIEAIRFGDRLKVVYNSQYTEKANIPPFILQPLLENAIKFGVYGHTGEVNIGMQIILEGGYLVVRVDNPFDADNRPPTGTGFGLEGIQRRLFLIYGRTDLLETRRDTNHFITLLKIPQ